MKDKDLDIAFLVVFILVAVIVAVGVLSLVVDAAKSSTSHTCVCPEEK